MSSTRKKFNSSENYNIYLEQKLLDLNLSEEQIFSSKGSGLFYGRINLNGQILVPEFKNLGILTNSNGQYALKFVCDAFDNLSYICKTSENTKNSKDLRFINLKPVKGYKNIEDKYNKYIMDIFALYMEDLEQSNRKNNIINFDTFIIDFIKFINNSANKIPILKSDFIISNNCNILDSGLAIELVSIPKEQDKRKVYEFWEAPEFPKFIENCKKMGFLIDKEYPWRIVFNVNSEEARKFLLKYNIDSSNYANLYTINNEMSEIENLKKYMLMFYNNIRTIEQQIQIPHINEEQKLIYNNFVRTSITKEQLEEKYPNEFWFKIYCHIYIVKNNLNLNQKQYINHINNLQTLFKSSMEEAIKYLNNILIKTPKTMSRRYEFTI